MAINLDNYEMVKDRLPLFYEKYPDGRVTTVVLHEDKDGATVQAFLWKNMDEQAHQTPLTTGIAHDKPTPSNPKNIETAETSALGRALANLNMYIKNRASREEMEIVVASQEEEEQAPPRKAPVKQAPIQTQAPDWDISYASDAADEYDHCPIHNDTWAVNPNSNFTWKSGEPQASHLVLDQDGEAVTNSFNGKNVYCNQPGTTITEEEFFRARHGWVAGTDIESADDLPKFIGTDNKGLGDWLNENGHGNNYAPAVGAIMDAIRSRKG